MFGNYIYIKRLTKFSMHFNLKASGPKREEGGRKKKERKREREKRGGERGRGGVFLYPVHCPKYCVS